MKSIHRVLVAVKNPDLRRQPGLEKAIDIARQLGASVELFHALAAPVALETEPLSGGRSLRQLRRDRLQSCRARLEAIAREMAQAPRADGLEIEVHATWDFPPHEAIVRRADAIHADLIIAECHEGRRLQPWLVHLTDWELLRLSTRPVLLLKNHIRWNKPVILAAVDPTHARAKPAKLDAAIVEGATRLGRKLRGSVELMHANFPTGFGLLMGDPALDGATVAKVFDLQKSAARAAFENFAADADVPKSRRHLVDADPVSGIPAVAEKLGAGLVVMGAVSRSGLKRVFVGNTAERVLASLTCDVLVLKPARSKRRVSRKSRGMRLVPTQPLMPLPV